MGKSRRRGDGKQDFADKARKIKDGGDIDKDLLISLLPNASLFAMKLTCDQMSRLVVLNGLSDPLASNPATHSKSRSIPTGIPVSTSESG